MFFIFNWENKSCVLIIFASLLFMPIPLNTQCRLNTCLEEWNYISRTTQMILYFYFKRQKHHNCERIWTLADIINFRDQFSQFIHISVFNWWRIVISVLCFLLNNDFKALSIIKIRRIEIILVLFMLYKLSYL